VRNFPQCILFQKFRIFPKRSRCIFIGCGKTSLAERKVDFQQESGFGFPEIDKRREKL